MVDLAERWKGGRQFWWVVDLSDGVTIDGASRVLVDVPEGELGCGDDQRSILSFQISVGDRVSFQLDELGIVAPPGEPRNGTDASSAVVVTARQFRIECPPGVDHVDAILAARQAQWRAAGITSYQFSLAWRENSDLAGDYRITVIDGEPVRIVRHDRIQFNPDRLHGRLPATIDAIFDELERNVTADVFTAEYDPRRGYPVDVHVDAISEAIDDELDIAIDDLTTSPVMPATSRNQG